MKTQIVLPDELAATLKKTIPARKRSAFIADAVEKQLKMKMFLEALRESTPAWTDRNHPDLLAKDGVKRYIARFRGKSRQRG